jgi:formate dehydrogenase major subunit/formate dehydrogenase alpha subunit
MSNSIEDITNASKAIFVIGSNTTEQHPVIGMRIRQAVKQRGAVLIVADPRRIPLTEFATIHLRHKPGTDNALISGLMNIILEKGLEDQAFIAERTEGFEEFRFLVRQYTPDKVAEITGVPVDQLYRAAEIMGTTKPMAVLWAMGITQHITGVRNVMNLANLQMLLGNMGVPGGGVNPLRGQNNVQGACDMGGLPNYFPGYQQVVNEEAVHKFEAAWGVSLPNKVGKTVTEMIPSILDGKIRALYIMGEDPLMSDPDTNHIRHCMDQCDFIVLQDIFPTETAPYADVLLPAASFVEKSGTFTNTERRIQLVRKAIQIEGDAWEDWKIIASLARRLLSEGKKTVGTGSHTAWDYTDPEEIMVEIASLTPSYAGVSHARLRGGETFQWPVKDATHPGTPILHVDKFTRGLGKFTPIEHIPPQEMPDDEYPMLLSTGRVLYHWHGGEMTRRSQGLLEIYSKPLIEINEEDARPLKLNGSKRIRVSSRRGSIEADAWVTDRVPPGMVYANFHFPEASANELTIAALDPVSKIPEFKICAVKIEAV